MGSNQMYAVCMLHVDTVCSHVNVDECTQLMNDEKNYCFFGTPYRQGKSCLCGWVKELEDEVPECYQQGKDGKYKIYVRGSREVSTSFGPQRSQQKADKTGLGKKKEKQKCPPTFIHNHKTNRITPVGEEWSQTMEEYLVNVSVKRNEKKGARKKMFICLGHVIKEERTPPPKKPSQKKSDNNLSKKEKKNRKLDENNDQATTASPNKPVKCPFCGLNFPRHCGESFVINHFIECSEIKPGKDKNKDTSSQKHQLGNPEDEIIEEDHYNIPSYEIEGIENWNGDDVYEEAVAVENGMESPRKKKDKKATVEKKKRKKSHKRKREEEEEEERNDDSEEERNDDKKKKRKKNDDDEPPEMKACKDCGVMYDLEEYMRTKTKRSICYECVKIQNAERIRRQRNAKKQESTLKNKPDDDEKVEDDEAHKENKNEKEDGEIDKEEDKEDGEIDKECEGMLL